MGKNGKCPDCDSHLTPVKLYAPEILRMFKQGHKEYSKHGILISYSVCLNHSCRTGIANLNSYDRVVESGMIRE